jgi:short subunit fatty acids transporter
LKKSWLDVFARWMERLVPDAVTTSILLMIVLFGTSLSLGHPLVETVDAYYRGLWMLLAFTMQMTLVLVLSLVIAATKLGNALLASIEARTRVLYGVRVPETNEISRLEYTMVRCN